MRIYKNIFSKSLIINILIMLLLVYFLFHSIYGMNGIISYFKLNQQLQKSISLFEDLRHDRMNIEHKVSLFRSESLDNDILEEYAKSLGIASPKEMVINIK